jgi:hypothetical protein
LNKIIRIPNSPSHEILLRKEQQTENNSHNRDGLE